MSTVSAGRAWVAMMVIRVSIGLIRSRHQSDASPSSRRPGTVTDTPNLAARSSLSPSVQQHDSGTASASLFTIARRFVIRLYLFLFIMKFVQLGTQIKTQCKKENIQKYTKSTLKVHINLYSPRNGSNTKKNHSNTNVNINKTKAAHTSFMSK